MATKAKTPTRDRKHDLATINPLASPKGVKFECEMCGKVACLQCPDCRVTYYCCKEHQQIDFKGIHEKICKLLAEIRSTPTLMGSERERALREQTREKIMLNIIEMSKAEAMKFLVSNHFELAMAGALQAQRHSMEIFGANRVELVPAYLLLAEASMGLEHHRQAEGYLSKAKYNVLKHPDCPNILRSRLHRACGRLYLVTGRKDEALQELANDIYYSSLDTGPEHIDTAPGYFHAANAFRIIKRDDVASAMYEKVIDIWYVFLNRALEHLAAQRGGSAASLRASALAISPSAADTSSGAPVPAPTSVAAVTAPTSPLVGPGPAADAAATPGAAPAPPPQPTATAPAGAPPPPAAPAQVERADSFILEETQVAETLDILTRIASHREERYGPNHPLTANLHRVLGMLYVYAGSREEGVGHLDRARAIYRTTLGDDDPAALDTARLLTLAAALVPSAA